MQNDLSNLIGCQRMCSRLQSSNQISPFWILVFNGIANNRDDHITNEELVEICGIKRLENIYIRNVFRREGGQARKPTYWSGRRHQLEGSEDDGERTVTI